MPELRTTLPFCVLPSPKPDPECPPQPQEPPPFTPQMQKVRLPTVEEVAVPRSRVKTTGDIPRAWVSRSNFDRNPVPATNSLSELFSSPQQTPPLIETPILKIPNKSKWVASPPTTPPRRYTPQVTDFALPRHRRYRLSIQWKPRPWDVEDPKARGSPLQEFPPISSRDSTWSSPCPHEASVPRRRKLRYSLEELAEHSRPRIRRRYTDGIVGLTKTERAEEIL